MRPKRQRREDQAAFAMEAGDRFHRIIVSDGVRYEADDKAETVITFFVIRRPSGFDIVNVLKTFDGDECVSRNVQTKAGIPPDRVAAEIDALRVCFALAIERAASYRLKWHELDLSDIEDHAGQVARIRAWGRVGVRLSADLPPIRLN